MANHIVVKAVVWGLVLSLNVQAHAERVSAYLEAKAQSPVLEIGAIQGDWSTVDSGNMIQGHTGLGTAWHFDSDWRLHVEQRMDYLLHFTPQTAQFYSALENNRVTAGRYPLVLSVDAVKANGLGLSHSVLLGHASTLRMTVNVYEGLRVQSGELVGAGVVAQDGSVQYQYDIDYGYDEYRLLDGARQTVAGWGYGFDIEYKARFNRWFVSLEFDDLLYRYFWDAPRDQGCLSRPLDADCSVQSKNRTWSQSLPHSQEGTVAYHLSRDLQKSVPSITYSWQAWGRYHAYWLGFEHLGFQANYEWDKKILGFAYESDWLKVKWQFDNMRPNQARYWQLHANVSWPIL